MQEDLLALMRALTEGAVKDEAMAHEAALVAEACQSEGPVDVAQAMWRIARNHRIRAMELRGQLAALCERYGEVDKRARP